MFALTVLAVSDDHRVRALLETVFTAEGHRVQIVSTDDEALHLLSGDCAADLVIREATRSRWNSRFQTADYLRYIDRTRMCLLLDPGDAVWVQFATQLGIDALLTKPILRSDLDKIIARFAPAYAAVASGPASVPMSDTTAYIEELDGGRFFLAGCPAMRQIYNNIRLLGPVDVPVLILGESGVGKEIVSMLLHKHSTRAQRGFMNVNCAALPPELLESELFGYEVGAFTGAAKAKPGKFELAHKGTILLDEIGEMSAPMQAKLLHVLQDGQFSRLGARSSTQVDVRVLAATNIHMEEAIADRRFREDLYYRLNAFSIYVPPLRERREEIPALLEQMLTRGAIELNRPPFRLSPALLEAAQEHTWPGNLRELRNFVTRTLVLRDEPSAILELRSKGRSQGNHFNGRSFPEPREAGHDGMKSIVRGVKDKAEIGLIQEALHASGWNRRRAATNLHISYRALLYKIQQYGLSPNTDRLSLHS
jgi:two-component system, NtrC family, response regulator AtoC